MKTKEELKALKEEVETVNRKRHELTDEELAQVSAAVSPPSLSPRRWDPRHRPIRPEQR